MNLQDLLILRLLTILNPGLEGAIFRILKILIVVVIVVMGAIFYSNHSKEQEILSATPMQLAIDAETGYLSFDVNKNNGFGSISFLAALKEKPLILKGGVPVKISVFSPPEISDSDDKNIKKLTFGTQEVIGYVPLSCVKQIAEANRLLYEKIQSLQKGTCSNNWCGYATNASELNPDLYKNQACLGFAVIPDVTPACAISLSGDVQSGGNYGSGDRDACIYEQTFIYTLKGITLTRSAELEALQIRKPGQVVTADPKSLSAIIENDEFSCLMNPYQSKDFCYNCSNPSSEMGRFVCKNSEVRKLDLIVSSSYKTRLALSQNPEQLKAEHAEWIINAQQCQDEVCMINAYQTRLSELSSNYHIE